MALKYKEANDRKYIVVHSSFTKADQDIGKEELDRKHRDLGMFEIGYHAIIRRDGIIEYGRPFNRGGIHTEGHDQHSIGICMIGGMSDKDKPQDNFTACQFKNLKWLLNSLRVDYPEAIVVGHNKLNRDTKCPSFSVPSFLMREGLANFHKPTEE